jgi:hypothetical protein
MRTASLAMTIDRIASDGREDAAEERR